MTETPETEPRAVVSRTPGEILKQAREGKDLSIAAIATQLNLDLRTIEALESGDQSRLPAPIFVRGYLRGYARLVGVREEEVLAAYQAQAPQEPTPRAISMSGGAPMRPAFRVPTIPWRGLLILILLAAAAGLAFEFGPQLINRFMPGATPEGASSSAPSLVLPVPGTGDTAMPGQPHSVPAAPGGGLDLPLPEPAPRADEDLQPPAAEEPEPVLPGDTDFGVTAPAEAVPETVAEPSAPAQPADQVQLDFNFTADSWVEVRGADRSKLLFGLMRKGDSRSVTGVAPISVLLGNSDAVIMKVNGSAFDHARYARNNVARFNVPAQP